MKFTTFLSLFILCAFTSKLPSASAVLVDTEGKRLLNGDIYGLRPVIITGNGGGVKYAATGNETGPLSVDQNPNHLSLGFRVQISTPPRLYYIEEGVNVILEFIAPPRCAPTPSLWTAVKAEEEELPVKLRGYANIVKGWFKTQSFPVDIGGYNILFCPLESSSCGYVGIQFYDARNRNLVVTQNADTALWVRFERLSPSSTATDLNEPSLLLQSHVSTQ